MVKRLRHRPFTAVTGVQIPLESLIRLMVLKETAVNLITLSEDKDQQSVGSVISADFAENIAWTFSSVG